MPVVADATLYYPTGETALDRCRAYIVAQLAYHKRPARSPGGSVGIIQGHLGKSQRLRQQRGF